MGTGGLPLFKLLSPQTEFISLTPLFKIRNITRVATRRDFLKALIAGGVGISATPFLGFGEASKFHFTQLIYRGEWDPRPRAFKRLMATLESRTSVETSFERKTLKIESPNLEGITFTDEDRTPVIYSRNDLGGAWTEDEFGKWQFECIPGGETQREFAFRLGLNIIMYSLTGNYKKDQIHTPFIKRRQRNL